MGQARRRGTFEERKAAAIAGNSKTAWLKRFKTALRDQAKPGESYRSAHQRVMAAQRLALAKRQEEERAEVDE